MRRRPEFDEDAIMEAARASALLNSTSRLFATAEERLLQAAIHDGDKGFPSVPATLGRIMAIAELRRLRATLDRDMRQSVEVAETAHETT